MSSLTSRVMRNGDEASFNQSVDELYDGKGFFFRQRRGHLNLRRLEGIDLERLVREVDVDILQQNIEDITFCEFGENDVHFLTDRQVVKIFRLSQLIIEYLLYSQGKLVGNLSTLSKKYSEKKRSLYRKRKELSTLKEEANSLYAQLKAKRRNLHTLEKILRDANDTADLQKPKEALAPKRSPFIKFFVNFPDGLFVEFEELPETPLRKLVSLVQNVIVNNQANEGDASRDASKSGKREESLPQIKLFLKGRMLLVDQTLTLEQCGVQSGDTLLASYTKPSAPAAPQPEKVIVEKVPVVIEKETANPRDQQMLDGIMGAVGKQLECIQKLTAEVNEWTSALQNMSKQQFEHFVKKETHLVGQIDDRLKSIENEVKENLVQVRELEEARRSISKPRKLLFGELEPDVDDGNNSQAIKEINEKLVQSGRKMDSLDSQMGQAANAIVELKNVIKEQYVQVSDLRQSLLDKLSQPLKIPEPVIIHQHAPQPVPAMAPMIAPVSNTHIVQETHHHVHVIQPEKPQPLPRKIESPPTPLLEDLQPLAPDGATPPASPVAPIHVPTPVQPVVAIEPAPVVAPVLKKPEPKPVVEEIVDVSTPAVTPVVRKLSLDFPIEFYSAEVKELWRPQDFTLRESLGADSIQFSPCTVVLAADLDIDDIVFQLRNSLASQLHLKLPSIALLLDQKKVIKLGVDVPKQLPFTVDHVREYVSTGRLRIHPVSRISNSQIDLLVPAYDQLPSKTKMEAKAAINKKFRRNYDGPEEPAEAKTSPSSAQQRSGAKGSRTPAVVDLSDQESYQKVRQSFEGLLQKLDRKGSLSDQELSRNRKELEQYYSSASASDSEHIKQYKSSLSKAMSTVTLLQGNAEVMQSDWEFEDDAKGVDGQASPRKRKDLGLLSVSLSKSFQDQRKSVASSVASSVQQSVRRSVEQFQQEKWYDEEDHDSPSYSAYGYGRGYPYSFDREDSVVNVRESTASSGILDNSLNMISSLDGNSITSLSHSHHNHSNSHNFSGNQPSVISFVSSATSQDSTVDAIQTSARPSFKPRKVASSNRLTSSDNSASSKPGITSSVEEAAPSYDAIIAEEDSKSGVRESIESIATRDNGNQSGKMIGKNAANSTSNLNLLGTQESNTSGLSSTLTSSLPDGLNLSTTIDSEGEMFLQRNPQLGETTASEIVRRADSFERRVLLTALDSPEDSPNASPFKSFQREPSRGRMGLLHEDHEEQGSEEELLEEDVGVSPHHISRLSSVGGDEGRQNHHNRLLLEDDNNSVHSLALSDSNNNFA